MLRYFLLFLSLFSQGIFGEELLPMKKDSKYGDDICGYLEHELHDIRYVKPCETGKYCETDNDNSYFYTCQDIPKAIKLKALNEECESDFECGNTLECKSKHCTLECGTNQVRYKTSNGYDCTHKDNYINDEYCYYYQYEWSTTTFTSIPTLKHGDVGEFQECGHIVQFNISIPGKVHSIQAKKPVYIGALKDGEYVTNKKFCQSGYALPFYAEQKLVDSSTYTNDGMFLMCVTPTNVDEGKKIVTYKINDGEEKLYDLNDATSYAIDNTYYNKYIVIESQRYKEYIGNLTDSDRENCGDLLDRYNRINCNKKDILRAWYFYKHPEDYMVYHDREDMDKVVDFLIQKDYYSYEFGNHLKFNIMLLISFLFFI